MHPTRLFRCPSTRSVEEKKADNKTALQMRRYTLKLNCFIKRICFCFVPVLISNLLVIYSWLCFWQSPSFRIERDVWQWIMHLENQTQITIDVSLFLCVIFPRTFAFKTKMEKSMRRNNRLKWCEFSISTRFRCHMQWRKRKKRDINACDHGMSTLRIGNMHCRWTVSAHACWRDVRMT